MKTQPLPEIDKTRIVISTITETSDEKDFWLTKTPQERWAAIETMRQIIYGYDPLTTRLQRVLEITQRTSHTSPERQRRDNTSPEHPSPERKRGLL
jgi:hypothetical protein